jgi:hypothetical protein
VGRTRKRADIDDQQCHLRYRDEMHTLRVSFAADEIGINPDQLSPMSKSTSGMADPFTQNSARILVLEQDKDEGR